MSLPLARVHALLNAQADAHFLAYAQTNTQASERASAHMLACAQANAHVLAYVLAKIQASA